ncbi:unnamed protein product [Sphenostylis stenocarpa]|uniref:Uncharacterized protein n=1 Tax=Sphenostylis stenocarpa TaxID=92480 RepID=A0AA86W2V8_9FABA|nr:unnamed protein product [Sphenostylis stenocarpa]
MRTRTLIRARTTAMQAYQQCINDLLSYVFNGSQPPPTMVNTPSQHGLPRACAPLRGFPIVVILLLCCKEVACLSEFRVDGSHLVQSVLSYVYRMKLKHSVSLKGATFTATNNTSAAASMICNEEGIMFKLVMAKTNMPDMDILSFLNLVLEKDIPVIFINTGVFDDVSRKALSTGLCYFLQEPITPNDLKYLWQHVYHSRASSARNTQNAGFQSIEPHAEGLQNTQMKQLTNNECQVLGAKRGRNDADIKGKRIDWDYTMPTTQCPVHQAYGDINRVEDMGKQKEKKNVEQEKPDSLRSAKMNSNINEYLRVSELKKRCTVWTPELHQEFLKAVQELGENNARPKQILVQMNLNGPYYLTVRQVASHLQKYRLRLKGEEKSRNSNLPTVRTSSSSMQKANYSPPEGSTLEENGLPAPKVILNVNHNQDQIAVNNAEKQADASDSQPMPGPSVDLNISETDFYELVRSFVEDCDCCNLYKNESNPAADGECTEMLRKVLDGKSSS